jgi:hypothetical protein
MRVQFWFIEQGKGGYMPTSNEQQIVVAKAFVLKDTNGREQARFAIRGGAPVLTLYDSKRKTRVKLTVRVDGPSLAFYDRNGTARARLNVRNDVPKMVIYDATGRMLHRAP